MSGPLTRRRFLARTALAAGVAVAAGACSDDADGGDGGVGPATTRRATIAPDLAVAELGARLERLAIDAYDATLAAAGGGRLATLPPALAELIATSRAHHQVHLDSWNDMLRAGGLPDVTEPHASLKPMIDRLREQATDWAGTARLALVLEDVAAQTYNRAIPTLKNPDAVRLAARMQVVDQQHLSVLRFMLGLYPVGSGEVQESRAFQPTDRAASG